MVLVCLGVSSYIALNLVLTGISKTRRIAHWSFDLFLISVILAAIKRLSGLGFLIKRIENPTIRSWIRRYLSIGEYLLNVGIVLANKSPYFGRKTIAPPATPSTPEVSRSTSSEYETET